MTVQNPVRIYLDRRRGVELFKMKCPAAPFLGSNVGDGLGEVPAVAVKVLSVVLALAIGLVLGFREDGGTVLSRSLAVRLNPPIYFVPRSVLR